MHALSFRGCAAGGAFHHQRLTRIRALLLNKNTIPFPPLATPNVN